MRRIAFDGLYQVRDQVVPSFELDIDLCPGILGLVTQADEPVKHSNIDDDKDDNDSTDYNTGYDTSTHREPP
jgi:hypothetical protein